MFSSQIKNLILNIDKPEQPLELDIVLEGGAFNGLYEIGAMLFIKQLEQQNYIHINRISGTSIGSLIGYSYFINQLEEIIDSYQNLREHWRENLNLEYYSNKIQEFFNKMTDEEFNNICSDKLYINYHNIENFENIIQSEYENKDDLMNAILKSSHIPHITTKEMCQERFFIDGGQPFIFHNREKSSNYNILYISINNLSQLSGMMNIKEINCHGKVLAGILECYQLFLTKQKNNLCSFLHQWNLYDYLSLRLKQFILKIIIILLFIYNKFKIETERNKYFNELIIKYIPENVIIISSNIFYYFLSIFKDLYIDFILYYCFN